MARIPTYTAEGGIPAGGTGPQASAAAFAAPARALGGLGETIAQTGEQVSRGMFKLAEVKKQRQEQDDAFWAANTATTLNRELLAYQRKIQDSETQAEDFLREAESRLTALESTAPNSNAAKRLRLAIDDNITAIYSRSLGLSSVIKEENRITEFKVNAQNIGQPINSSDELTKPLALMTAQSMIGQQLQLINSLPYSEASKRKIRGAFIEELALNVSTNAPEFALNLINTTDLDESRKSTLRKQIDSYVEFNNSAAIYNYENGPNGKLNEIKSIYNTGVPIKPPSDAELMSVYGKERWQLKRAQFDELYRVANTVVDEFNKVRDLPYDRQFAAVAPKLSPKDPEVSEKLREMLEKSKEEQEKRIHTWMMQNNSQVRDAFAVAYSAPEKDRPAKLTAARALSLKYQGSPEDENDPNASKYHRLPARLQQVMTQSEAEERTKKMNAMGDDALATYINQFAIEYPDDDQRAIAYNNLVTLPKNGISPDIQFSQMITDPQRRVNILGVMRNQAYVRAFTQEEDNDFVKALNGNEKWEPFHKNIDPTFNPQRPEIKGFYDAVISYAKRISVKENIKASKAVEMAVNDLISHDDETSGPWYFTDSINGQQLAIQAARDDLGLKPSRTASEVKAIGEKLRFAIKQIPIDKVAIKNPNGTSIFPGADLIIDEAEKQKFIQTAIRSQSVWITNPNGQGAQLYLNGRDFGRFPLKDRNGKIFEVDYDEIARAPLDPFAETSVQGPVIPYGEGKMENVYMQFRRQYPVSINLPATAISPMEIDAVGSEFMLNIMSQYWKNLKFSKTTK